MIPYEFSGKTMQSNVTCYLSCLEPTQPTLEEGEAFEAFWLEVFGKTAPPPFSQGRLHFIV